MLRLRGRDRAGDEARDHRDRGPPLLHQRRRRPARHRPRALPGRRAKKARPGRLDDHAAVRQERARRPGRPHAVPEAARGRARVPDHAQVVQGADPAQLPQHDLLRQRRLRDRVGRAHVLRQRSIPGCGEHGRARLRVAARRRPRRRCWPGWSPRPSGYDPLAHPEAAARRRDLVLQRMLEQGFLTERAVRRAPRRADPDARRHPAAGRGHRRTRTSPRGSSSRSSTSSAAARPARGARSRAA